MKASILSAIFGALASGILAGILLVLRRIHKEIQQFLTERLYLLASADWSKTSILLIASQLGMDVPEPPVMGRHKIPGEL